MTDHLMNTYARLPLRIVRGEGAWLIDDEGQRYFDAITGIGVCGLGHSHPDLTRALADQAGRLIHAANIAHVPLQEELADQLAELSGMDAAFFCNSGAESLECAFKLARLKGHERGFDTPIILVVEGSFHGRTLACLSATDSRKVQAGFEPLVPGFARVPFGDSEALEAAVKAHPQATAVLLEPILGEGGVVVPPEGFLREVRDLCDRHRLLMMLDEVQTGLGKTGDWFAYQHEGVLPDVVSCAKALGNGVPIGACLARGEAAQLFQPGKHGSTYGGNPLACRAALTVLEVMRRDQLLEHARSAGERFRERLREGLADVPVVREVRGRGLMVGVEFDRDCGALRDSGLARGYLLNVTRERVLRLLPPLIAGNEELNGLADTVIELAREFGEVQAA